MLVSNCLWPWAGHLTLVGLWLLDLLDCSILSETLGTGIDLSPIYFAKQACYNKCKLALRYSYFIKERTF